MNKNVLDLTVQGTEGGEGIKDGDKSEKDEDGYSPWRMAWLADLSLDISDEAVSRDCATRGVLQCLAGATF